MSDTSRTTSRISTRQEYNKKTGRWETLEERETKAPKGRRGVRPGFWEGNKNLIGSNLGEDWRQVKPTTVARRGSGLDPYSRWAGRQSKSLVKGVRDKRRGRGGLQPGDILVGEDWPEEEAAPEEVSSGPVSEGGIPLDDEYFAQGEQHEEWLSGVRGRMFGGEPPPDARLHGSNRTE